MKIVLVVSTTASLLYDWNEHCWCGCVLRVERVMVMVVVVVTVMMMMVTVMVMWRYASDDSKIVTNRARWMMMVFI